MNVDLSRTPMNVTFKGCGNLTYNEYLDQLVDQGKVSLRGLKPDAKVFDEMILDVNTEYFEQNGTNTHADSMKKPIGSQSSFTARRTSSPLSCTPTS